MEYKMLKIGIFLAPIALAQQAATPQYVGTLVEDTCRKGTDSDCHRFGSDMCCAHVVYSFKGDKQDFYACAMQQSIEAVEGRIYDSSGYTGHWYCAHAVSNFVSYGVFALATASLM